MSRFSVVLVVDLVQYIQFSSVAQSCPTLCDPLDCSMPGLPVHHSSWNYSNSCPLSWWCHQTISSPVVPFCLQSFPAAGPFPISRPFILGGQRIGASASVLPMYIQGWLPLGLTGLIFLLSKRLSRDFCSTIIRRHQFFSTQPFILSSSHIHTWPVEKP